MDGSAREEGLSHSGKYYAEAIECLQSRYENPCIIHQIHVRKILEAPVCVCVCVCVSVSVCYLVSHNLEIASFRFSLNPLLERT